MQSKSRGESYRVYVVDASVWVSRLLGTDIHYEPSRLWLERQIDSDEALVIPAHALAEIGGVLARRTRDSAHANSIVSLIRQLPNTRLIPIDLELADLGAETASSLRLRGADAIYVALARRLGLPLITWDQEQLERGASQVATNDPREALERYG